MRVDIHNSEIPTICRACEARHRGICGALSPEQLVELNRSTRRELIPSGSSIAADDQETTRYANILHGVVKLSKLMGDGRQQIVGLQFAPDFLGRPFRETSNVGVEAATEIQVCSFPKKAIEEMIRKSPELEHRLYEQTLRELDEAREWMLTLGRKTAPEKVASFIHMIAMHSQPEREETDNIAIELPLKRAEIADFLGLTIETVSRQITKLRKAGIIDVLDGRMIRVPSMARLYSACGR
ncbi:MAG: Crp/Fnr family transcriptional regulator [Rhizobiales bacterium]|nr:Crp/Fnr family transcriptional regulator [Hyphomicrobiales bacterium]